MIPVSAAVLSGAARLVQRERSVRRKRSRTLWWLRAQESRGDVVVTCLSLTSFFWKTINLPSYLLKRKRKWGGKERGTCDHSAGWQAERSRTAKPMPPKNNLPLRNRVVAHTHTRLSAALKHAASEASPAVLHWRTAGEGGENTSGTGPGAPKPEPSAEVSPGSILRERRRGPLGWKLAFGGVFSSSCFVLCWKKGWNGTRDPSNISACGNNLKIRCSHPFGFPGHVSLPSSTEVIYCWEVLCHISFCPCYLWRENSFLFHWLKSRLLNCSQNVSKSCLYPFVECQHHLLN